MGKVFEDYFSEIQSDMVEICLEYVENRAEKIYIYGSYENGITMGCPFYKINGMIVKQHKLNDTITSSDVQYDVSDERQEQVIDGYYSQPPIKRPVFMSFYMKNPKIHL